MKKDEIKQIKEYLEAHSMSQKKVALGTGYSTTHISLVLSRKSNPTRKFLDEIQKFLQEDEQKRIEEELKKKGQTEGEISIFLDSTCPFCQSKNSQKIFEDSSNVGKKGNRKAFCSNCGKPYFVNI